MRAARRISALCGPANSGAWVRIVRRVPESMRCGGASDDGPRCALEFLKRAGTSTVRVRSAPPPDRHRFFNKIKCAHWCAFRSQVGHRVRKVPTSDIHAGDCFPRVPRARFANVCSVSAWLPLSDPASPAVARCARSGRKAWSRPMENGDCLSGHGSAPALRQGVHRIR